MTRQRVALALFGLRVCGWVIVATALSWGVMADHATYELTPATHASP